MKKVVVCILVLASLITLSCPAYAAEARLVNAQSVTLTLTISDSGVAKVSAAIVGTSALVKSEVMIYLEKNVGGTWVRVDIGTTNNVWEYSTTSRVSTKSFSTQLNATGNYRVVAEFTLTASAVETITKTSMATY